MATILVLARDCQGTLIRQRISWYWLCHKGPDKRGQIVADTLLPTQMFPRSRNICCGQKLCLVSGTFCVRNKCFPVCAAWKQNIHFVSRAFERPRNIMSNNVSETMCPRLPGP